MLDIFKISDILDIGDILIWWYLLLFIVCFVKFCNFCEGLVLGEIMIRMGFEGKVFVFRSCLRFIEGGESFFMFVGLIKIW